MFEPGVYFRGPMLNVVKGHSLHRILIPDAMRRLPYGRHGDRWPAVPHVAGVLIVSGDDPSNMPTLLQISLRGKDVLVHDGTRARCTINQRTLAGTVPLRSMTNKGSNAAAASLLAAGQDFNERVASEVVILGGELAESSDTTDLVYTLPTDCASGTLPGGKIPLFSHWRTPSNARVIEFADRATGDLSVLPLEAGQSALFYNWDLKVPDASAFFNIGATDCSGGKVIVDVDFKWLYQLLDVPNGDWDAWRGDCDLPTPHAICPGTAGDMHTTTAPGSDCVHGFWDIS